MPRFMVSSASVRIAGSGLLSEPSPHSPAPHTFSETLETSYFVRNRFHFLSRLFVDQQRVIQLNAIQPPWPN
jgi:hypothetical protein